MERPRVLIFIRENRVTSVEVDTELAPLVTVMTEQGKYTDSAPFKVVDLGGMSWWQADFEQ